MAAPLNTEHPFVITAAQAVTGVLRLIDANLSFVLCGEVAYNIYRGWGTVPPVRSLIPLCYLPNPEADDKWSLATRCHNPLSETGFGVTAACYCACGPRSL